MFKKNPFAGKDKRLFSSIAFPFSIFSLFCLVLTNETTPYAVSNTPPNTKRAAWLSSVISLLAPKYAIEKNIKSEKTTPRSVKKACLIPLDMLVSNNIKNKGPKEKDKRNVTMCLQ